ncbi:MAG: cystathionine beta-lyase [Pseudomonadota bacterium]|jgi:cystathionine beta-lyase
MTRKETRINDSGRTPSDHFGAVNTPVYRASTILFPDTATLESGAQPYAYGRRATPTTRALEDALCELEGGARTMLTPSGLSACTLAILCACSAGDHILLTDSVYGPTRSFCDRVAKRYGIEASYFPPAATPEEVAAQFKPNTKAVFLESPGSLTFEVQDVPAIAALARAKGIAVLLDNTWATPLYFNALEHGVDYSIQSATKYIGGHADATAGSVTVNDAHLHRLEETHGGLGLCLGADDAFMIARGLRTLAVRMARQQQSAHRIATWLTTCSEVAKVLYPALDSDPGYAIWKRDFTGAPGLFSIVFQKDITHDKVAAFVDGLKLFGIGYSWGGFESLALPAHFHRSFPHPGREGEIVRLHIGLEDPHDLMADLERGLMRLY